MSKPAKLIPHKSSNGSWVLSIPPALSKTGKRRREFFENQQQAEIRASELKAQLAAGVKVIQRAGPDLIRDAVNFDELYRDIYGFKGGLKEACECHMRWLDQQTRAVSFGQLLTEYESAKIGNWGEQYRSTWKTLRKNLSDIESTSILVLDSEFWRNWLISTAGHNGWGDRTCNDYTSMLASVWKYAVALEYCEKNPINGIIRRKISRKEKAVYSVEQVKAVLNSAWEHDPDLVPFFAITIFGGVRPDVKGEAGKLTWEDLNFEDNWIRVAGNFDNKTQTKRFVPIEPNLKQWLAPWRNATGNIIPPNFIKRRRYLTRGKYQSPPGTLESEWVELVPYGQHVRDITRHTYGSYLEAKCRDRNTVKENMGHSDFTTYEQHYRNTRSPKEAEEFWGILPPEIE